MDSVYACKEAKEKPKLAAHGSLIYKGPERGVP